ncbi:MAG: hypothetical protein AAF717_02135 [Bacteroidota bacterium]
MKKIYTILLVGLLGMSCSSDGGDESTPMDTTPAPVAVEGKQVFRVDFVEVSAKTSGVAQKNLEPAFALVSILDNNSAPVLTREKIALIKEEDRYSTSELTLAGGTYRLTEFIVTDENDIVISLAPQENSVLAQFATAPLPIEFEISSDITRETVTENINAAGYTPVDFGYTGLSLVFPENTDFFSLTVDDSELRTQKTLKLESITGSVYVVDWGDGTVEEYVSTTKDSGAENEITHLYAENGEFTIKVSGAVAAIETLSFIGEIPGELYQYESNLVAVDLSQLTLLKDFNVFKGKLTNIDISKNTALENLSIRSNQLTNIDLSNNPNLKEVFLEYNALTSIDVAPHLDLRYLNVQGNQLTDLDVSVNTSLEVLFLRRNQLSAIELSNNPELRLLDLHENRITTLDISNNTKLLDITLRDNALTELDVSMNPDLRFAYLSGNQIASIDVSANLNLKGLYIGNNQLSTLDLSNNTALEYLVIEGNMFSELDLTSNPKIFIAHIGKNQFNATELDTIIAQIHTFAIANATVNGYIDYQNNPGFAEVDASTIAKLNELVADYNWTLNNN